MCNMAMVPQAVPDRHMYIPQHVHPSTCTSNVSLPIVMRPTGMAVRKAPSGPPDDLRRADSIALPLGGGEIET